MFTCSCCQNHLLNACPAYLNRPRVPHVSRSSSRTHVDSDTKTAYPLGIHLKAQCARYTVIWCCVDFTSDTTVGNRSLNQDFIKLSTALTPSGAKSGSSQILSYHAVYLPLLVHLSKPATSCIVLANVHPGQYAMHKMMRGCNRGEGDTR